MGVLDDLDLSKVTDPEAQRILGLLLNVIATQEAEIATLRAENQRLRDENNRLKGEQGAPTILPSKRAAADHASERERGSGRVARPRGDKRSLLHIDRTQEQEVDPALLPADAERKGYAEFVVQDVTLHTDTVLFRCARWYAASTGRSYQASLPDGYADQGHYGPGLKALALQLYYQGQMSEPKILEVLQSVGIVISAAHLATLLIDQPVFAAEYEEIARAGLGSNPSQHLDDTSTRVDGVEEHCPILCGPLFTLYRTTPRKDRQAVLDVLRLGAPRAYQLNRYAWAFLAAHGRPGAVVTALGRLPQGVDLDADTCGALLGEHIPRLGPHQRQQILDAAAIGAYRVQQAVPVVEILVCDDAPQVKGVTAELALCWVHAGRHFKKLTPLFAAEYEDIARAGLASSPFQHLDDTRTRVNGVEEHCHILCGPLYTLYRTTPRKDRQTVLDVLRLDAPRAYQLNRYAWAFLAAQGLPAAVLRALGRLPQGVDLDADTFGALLEEHVPRLGVQQRQHILDAAAIGAYRVQQEVPVVEILVCDDAPQFKGVTAELALCWVHAGRHFKKLTPLFAHHRALVEAFLTDFWAYYHALQAYRTQPTLAERARLNAAFDTLFARRTGYWHLDERIATTAAKKEALLCVLAHPDIPLHNNPAELGARHRVRKRDVSFGPRSQAGITAWDICGTITQTAAKLGVNVAHYLHDRLSGAYQMPSLAALITQRTAAAHSGSAVALAAA